MPKKYVINDPSPTSQLMHSPFDCLKGLVDFKDIPPSGLINQLSPIKKETPFDPQSEEQLFHEAMEGVKPIKRDQVVVMNIVKQSGDKTKYIFEDETLSRLVRLVDHGEGFIVSDTPEYIEGIGYNVHRNFAQRLHQGYYSIQAHIDLHGLTVRTAGEAFESFLKTSIHSGKRAVLIIHGRGLSSPGEPVLKNKIRQWLNQSYWLKRVIAFTSAQSYDGGAGATYVLLRSRPVSVKSKKARSNIYG
jgi:DNA-nicking Smr family endonuclease